MKENSLDILEENFVSEVWNDENEILETTFYRDEKCSETDCHGLQWMMAGNGYINPQEYACVITQRIKSYLLLLCF